MTETPAGVRRVVLLGFMGSGKSTVGPALARRLGWDYLDLDNEIELREGRPISDIFRTEGEDFFRALEAKLTREVAGRGELVLSPGGGWITNPGLLDLLGPATLSIWLKVSAETVIRRVGSSTERPLLISPDPLATARRLLAEREPRYRSADREVLAEGRTVEAIVDEIAGYLQECMFTGNWKAGMGGGAGGARP